MGGKSSSKSSTSTNQTTTQGSTDGIVGGDVFQGQQITYSNEFGSGVENIFRELIGLVGDTQDIAANAGQLAIDTVSKNEETQTNPELATLTKLLPVIMFGVAAVVVVLIFRKK